MNIVELNRIEKSSVSGGAIAPFMARFGGALFSFFAISIGLFIASGGTAEFNKKDASTNPSLMVKGAAIINYMGTHIGWKKIGVVSSIFWLGHLGISYVTGKIKGGDDSE